MPKWRYVNLRPEELPKEWYNIVSEFGDEFPPPKDPDEGPSRLAELPNMLIEECLKQEMSRDRWVPIPEELLEIYTQAGRPRPLFRAYALEKALDTPARLYYKAEFYSPTGSHKVNTALAQCYYAKKAGFKRVTTETGAGQWGTAIAYASALMGLKSTIYWVRAVHDWKHDRRTFMKLYGAEVFASPSPNTEFGKSLYDKNPRHNGSLSIAISEGLEDSKKHPDAVYTLGSVLSHVLMHQTIIGLETKKQFEIFDDYPDIMISCLGGGSNFGGFVLPFAGDAYTKGLKTKFLAIQSEVAPNLQGEYKYDFADHAELTPMLKMYTIGHQKEMAPIKGDGLRYHGAAPVISFLRSKGMIDTKAYPGDEKEVFAKARMFVQTEGHIPAPESAYSVAGAIDEALRCKESGESKCIAFNISGHGFLDIPGYRDVLGLD